MRRTALLPLIAAGALVTLLVPAAAFGLLGQSDPGSEGAATGQTAGTPAVDPSPVGTSTAAASTGANAASAPVVLAASGKRAMPSAARPAARALDVRPIDRPIDHPELHIRLGCALVTPDAASLTDALVVRPDVAPAVTCRWTALDVDAVRSYQLWRAIDVPGGYPRDLIATVPVGDPLRHVDTRISRGHIYTYAVVAVAGDGSKLAVSNPVAVKVPPAADALSLACVLTSNGDQRGVACKWSKATHPAAAGYQLWRSVDGGPREAIYKTGLDGRRGFFDTKIKPGQTIRYAVIVVDRAGRVVGHGGPVAVRIPPPADALRMACALASQDDRPVVACKWTEASHPAAVGYVLWRSVDGGARKAIYRTGLDRRPGFIDRDVKPGQSIRYSVVVVDKSGQTVGYGSPVVVKIPALAPVGG